MILKVSYRPLAFILFKAFFKEKNKSGTTCFIFYVIFEEKYFSRYILLADQIQTVWSSLLLKTLRNMCILIDWSPDCDVINYKINLSFLMKPFLRMTEVAKQSVNDDITSLKDLSVNRILWRSKIRTIQLLMIVVKMMTL